MGQLAPKALGSPVASPSYTQPVEPSSSRTPNTDTDINTVARKPPGVTSHFTFIIRSALHLCGQNFQIQSLWGYRNYCLVTNCSSWLQNIIKRNSHKDQLDRCPHRSKRTSLTRDRPIEPCDPYVCSALPSMILSSLDLIWRYLRYFILSIIFVNAINDIFSSTSSGISLYTWLYLCQHN